MWWLKASEKRGPHSSPTFSLVPKGAWDCLILELQFKGLRKDICSQEA